MAIFSTIRRSFLRALKPLVDHIHSVGLRFGIYSDAGYKTCGGFPGSLGYEYQDARTYAEWGVDYLKVRLSAIPGLRVPLTATD